MKALFTHAWRSVRRSPWQTILLLLTVFFSAIIFACIYEVNVGLRTERSLSAQVKYGHVDILATADEDGGSRYLSVKEMQAVAAEENARADGYFILPVADGQGTLLGAAANLQTIDDFAFFAFEEYHAFPQTEINSAIFVSRDFAKARGLALGQELTVRLLGREKTYVVQGINRYRFFGDYDLLVNGEGALGVLTGISPVFALFDGQNLPCSELLIKTEKDNVEEVVEKINAALQPYGWGAEARGGLDLGYFDVVTDVLTGVIFLFSLVVAGMLVGFSLKILSEKRRKETQVFLLSGTPPSKIFLAFCIETLLTLVIGTALGVVGAALFLRSVSVRFTYATLSLSGAGVLVCAFAESLVGSAVLLLHGISSRKRKTPRKEAGARVCLCSLASLLVIVGGSFLAPVRIRWIFAVFALFAFLSTLLFGVAPTGKAIARLLSPKRADEGKRVRPALTLAAKNNANVLELRNVYRVLCTLLSVLVVVAACIGACNRQYAEAVNYFRCDYIVANAKGAASAIEGLEGTEGCSSTFQTSAEFPDGKNILLLDTEDISYAGDDLRAEDAPTGNGICLSKVVARLYGFSLGDTVTLTVRHKAYEFVLTGYCGETATVAFIDAKACGFQESFLLVRRKAGTDSAAYLSALTDTLAKYGAVIQTPHDILKSRIEFAYNFKNLMNDYVRLLVPLALLGCFNLVWVSYARRKKQFADLTAVGMTRGDVARMVALEGVILLSVTLVFSTIGGGFLCGLLDGGMQSFGFRLFV